MPSVPVDPLAPGNPLGLWPQQLELARRVRRAMDTGERIAVNHIPRTGKMFAANATVWPSEVLPPPTLPEVEIPVAGAVKIRPARMKRAPRGKGKKDEPHKK